MTIDGKTLLYGVIGDPVHAVRSPEWFNALFARQGIHAVMLPMQVAGESLAAAFDGLKRIGNLRGLVVTMPHKATMPALLDELGPAARALGAVNAARRLDDGRWIGDMFDGKGCVAGLRAQGHEVTGRSVFVLGTGAAGSAVAFALAEAGVKRLVLHDADAQRSERVAERIRSAIPRTDVSIAPLHTGPACDIAINATPLGMRPEDPLPFDPAILPETTLIVDVITKPEITPFLERAAQTGHRTHSGKHMHAGQAMEAARFFGFDPDR